MCRLPVLLPSSQPSNWPLITSLGIPPCPLCFSSSLFTMLFLVSVFCFHTSHSLLGSLLTQLLRLSSHAAPRKSLSSILYLNLVILGWFCPPGHIWEYLETFMIATTEGVLYWHLVSRSQGYCYTPYSAGAALHNEVTWSKHWQWWSWEPRLNAQWSHLLRFLI